MSDKKPKENKHKVIDTKKIHIHIRKKLGPVTTFPSSWACERNAKNAEQYII